VQLSGDTGWYGVSREVIAAGSGGTKAIACVGDDQLALQLGGTDSTPKMERGTESAARPTRQLSLGSACSMTCRPMPRSRNSAAKVIKWRTEQLSGSKRVTLSGSPLRSSFITRSNLSRQNLALLTISKQVLSSDSAAHCHMSIWCTRLWSTVEARRGCGDVEEELGAPTRASDLDGS